MKFGEEFIDDPRLGGFRKAFVRLFGNPVLGLRIRARKILSLIDALQLKPDSHILDAGSGRGMFTFYLAKRFPECKVVGADIGTEQLEVNNTIAERRQYRNLSFKRYDVTEMEAREEYDLITATDILEHLDADKEQCDIFFNALKLGGRFLIHVPHATRNVFGIRTQNFMGIEGHVRPGYTMEGLRCLLTGAGFRIEEAGYNYGYFETLANNISYYITGGREKRALLYAAAFPFLLLLSQLSRLEPEHEGSGLVFLAIRPEERL